MNKNILKQTLLYSHNKHLYFALLNSRIFSDIKNDLVLQPIFEFKKYFPVGWKDMIDANDLNGIIWRNKFKWIPAELDNFIDRCIWENRNTFKVQQLLEYGIVDIVDINLFSGDEIEYSIYTNRLNILKYLIKNIVINPDILVVLYEYSIRWENLYIYKWLCKKYSYLDEKIDRIRHGWFVNNRYKLILQIKLDVKSSRMKKYMLPLITVN